ncbi:MAG: phytanoyl-CoA dioxygenase family protein [Rhodospirillaceae bacterium]|nr:phytanoyl-CoA dioxygenase family protein [Rhodospirillaceae bacterium]
MLSEAQIETYAEQGFVIARAVVSDELLAQMRAQLDAWTEESRYEQANYGEILGGKARFDLQPGHSPDHPQLRRVANPIDISKAYHEALFEGPVVELVAELLGPDVVFHHCKLNIKAPGAATRVDYHQDHAFTPHTNDDMITALVLLDDMFEANGCLTVVPGSHKERCSHWRDGRFVGRIDAEMDAEFDARAMPIEGRAGDVCYMHNWSVHGGGPNMSDEPRRLLICDYSAADAKPLVANPVPTVHEGRVVHGQASRIARLTQMNVELPEIYDDDSFFVIQEREARKVREEMPS